MLNHGDLVLHGTAQELRSRRELLEASYLGEAEIDVAAARGPN